MSRAAVALVLFAATATAAEWELGEDESAFDAVPMLSQAAGNTIKDEYATKDVTPVLAFRCRLGDPTIEVAIDWQRFISSFNTEVGFKVDDGKTLWQKWGVDSSNRITLAKSAADSKALIDSLSSGQSLSVEVAPYSEPPVTVSFDLAGFAAAIANLKGACG